MVNIIGVRDLFRVILLNAEGRVLYCLIILVRNTALTILSMVNK